MKQIRKRLFITRKMNSRERVKKIKWATENEYNTLVFPLNDKFFKGGNAKYIKLAKHYAFYIEAGGQDISLLLPRNLYLFNRELFRMEQGKRRKAHHLCPTNPKSIAVVADNTRKYINRVLHKISPDPVFHLLPDEGFETTWCQCPACRAFRPAEQYLITVNTAADMLAKINASAKLHYIDFDMEPEAARVKTRTNTVVSEKI
ncbi:MAG: hypothetical protein FWB95_04270 [Treponema sp.]|nr:hypothetical protein [Treponema sp.]